MANKDHLLSSMSQIAAIARAACSDADRQRDCEAAVPARPRQRLIFATWCGEMGLIGALLVILLFAYLIYRPDSVWRAMHRINSAVFWRPVSP